MIAVRYTYWLVSASSSKSVTSQDIRALLGARQQLKIMGIDLEQTFRGFDATLP